MEGELKAGRYKIVREIGRGGMSVVYLAYDTRLKSTVALKMLPAEMTQDPEFRRLLIDEAVKTRAIGSHPGIPTVYGVESDGEVFVVEEYVEGVLLRQRLEEQASFTSKEIFEIGILLCEALSVAHDRGLVHRDLKPENIMLTPVGRGPGSVKILDFGLAKRLLPAKPLPGAEAVTENDYCRTGAGDFKGTVAYSAPEQIPGMTRGAVDAKTDIYALGLVLYEMATGTNPFMGTTRNSTFNNIRTREPPSLKECNPKADPELDRILRKCLEKRREERYQSARELKADLDNALHHRTWLIPRARARALFVLIQLGYLAMYSVALYRLGDIELASVAAGCSYLAWPFIACALVGTAVRLYFLAAVSFNYPDTGRHFHLALPAILSLDLLWAASPLLLMQQIRGLLLVFAAGLAFLPFSQRWLLYTSYAPAGGHTLLLRPAGSPHVFDRL